MPAVPEGGADRCRVLTIPPQEVITRDNVPARVNAVVLFRVVDPVKSVMSVQNHTVATSQVAQTTLRSVVGRADLDTLLAHRADLNEDLAKSIAVLTETWGVRVGAILGTEGRTLGTSPIFLLLFLGFIVAGAGLGTAIRLLEAGQPGDREGAGRVRQVAGGRWCVAVWADNGGLNQQWAVTTLADGYRKLINRNSGKALDVANKSLLDNGAVVQWTDNGGANQQWTFTAVQ